MRRGRSHWVGAYYDRAHAPQQVDQIGLRTRRPETGRWSDLSRVAYVDNDVEGLSTATNDRGDLVVGWTDATMTVKPEATPPSKSHSLRPVRSLPGTRSGARPKSGLMTKRPP